MVEHACGKIMALNWTKNKDTWLAEWKRMEENTVKFRIVHERNWHCYLLHGNKIVANKEADSLEEAKEMCENIVRRFTQ